MSTIGAKTTLSGLARKLVSDGVLKEEVAEKAVAEAAKRKVNFVTHLVENKLANSTELANAASREFGIPLFDLTVMELDPAITKMVEEKLIRTHNALPLFKRGNRMFVAVSDPTNLVALDAIRFHVNAQTEAVLVEEHKLAATIEKAIAANDTSMKDLGGDADLENLEISAEDEEGKGDGGE